MGLFWLAEKLGKRYHKYSRGFTINAVGASYLLLFFLTLSSAIVGIVNHLSEDDLRIKQIIISSFIESDDGSSRREDLTDETLQLISEIEGVDQISVKYNVVDPDLTMKISSIEVPIRNKIDGVNEQYAVFDRMQIHNANDEYGFDGNPIIAGRSFGIGDVSSAIVDENFVYILGYENPNDILGKTFILPTPNKRAPGLEPSAQRKPRLGRVPNTRRLRLTEL